MKIYHHRRLVFGLRCSPFLLGAVINNLLENFPQEYCAIVEILKKSFYVDNCITSVDIQEELSEFVNGATELIKLGNFELRGWENTSKDADSIPSHVLGFLWERKEDLTSISKIDITCEPVSRRNVLSCILKVFDPIGFTCPVTIVPKLLLQETCRKKLSWDELLPMHAEKKFRQWLKDLAHLNDIKIPRYAIPIEFRGYCRMHTFCGTSLSSYACVVYLRSK
ncbi:uncharacterized protein LOC129959819 [Argiope bruennichi]|uniref:uncharacterized protein LOC129959819 n=1 Tax=Argiope bruennichi TaxID=94029 RepID=UPI002494598E|nr:uncharacterized protein LOC129959819 [Argiope bruennichi]